MTLSPNIGPKELEQYREYLMTIADLQIEPVLRRKLDASDVVQQTMLEAHSRLNDFRGSSSAELAGWLKRILLNNLIDCVRGYRRERRDIARERSLDDSLNRSSLRLEACLAAEQSSPSLKVSRDEEGACSFPKRCRDCRTLNAKHSFFSTGTVGRSTRLPSRWGGAGRPSLGY